MFLLRCDAQAGTPGCTKEACKFRDEYGKFVDAECEVFGISSDTPEANAAFAKKERLPFPLLSDQNDFLRKSFGIKGNVFGMLKGRQVRSIVCALYTSFLKLHHSCHVSRDTIHALDAANSHTGLENKADVVTGAFVTKYALDQSTAPIPVVNLCCRRL